jgi:hypothetical protein
MSGEGDGDGRNEEVASRESRIGSPNTTGKYSTVDYLAKPFAETALRLLCAVPEVWLR